MCFVIQDPSFICLQYSQTVLSLTEAVRYHFLRLRPSVVDAAGASIGNRRGVEVLKNFGHFFKV